MTDTHHTPSSSRETSSAEASVNFHMGAKSGIGVVQRKLGALVGEILEQGHPVSYSNLGHEGYHLIDKDPNTGELLVDGQKSGDIGSIRDMTGRMQKNDHELYVPALNEKAVLDIT